MRLLPPATASCPSLGRLLESSSSQYRSLAHCLYTYLRLHPDRAGLQEHYKRSMVRLQPQVRVEHGGQQ
jgi:hypothetical protein